MRQAAASRKVAEQHAKTTVLTSIFATWRARVRETAAAGALAWQSLPEDLLLDVVVPRCGHDMFRCASLLVRTCKALHDTRRLVGYTPSRLLRVAGLVRSSPPLSDVVRAMDDLEKLRKRLALLCPGPNQPYSCLSLPYCPPEDDRQACFINWEGRYGCGTVARVAASTRQWEVVVEYDQQAIVSGFGRRDCLIRSGVHGWQGVGSAEEEFGPIMFFLPRCRAERGLVLAALNAKDELVVAELALVLHALVGSRPKEEDAPCKRVSRQTAFLINDLNGKV